MESKCPCMVFLDELRETESSQDSRKYTFHGIQVLIPYVILICWVLKCHTCNKNKKIKLFKKFWILLDRSRIIYEFIIWRFNLLRLWIFFKGYIITNHKSSNYLIFNSNLHELPIRNLLNPYLKERDWYV